MCFLFRTSSTSVEQARERSYHRALLLSKDKDTGESLYHCWVPFTCEMLHDSFAFVTFFEMFYFYVGNEGQCSYHIWFIVGLG